MIRGAKAAKLGAAEGLAAPQGKAVRRRRRLAVPRVTRGAPPKALPTRGATR